MARITLVALAILAAVGCGGNNVYHCDFTNSEDPEPRCQERSNDIPGPGAALTAETYQETCEAVQGDGGDGACPDGAVAGCEYPEGGAERVIDWYYAPKTLADVEAECEDDDATLVMP